MENFTSGIVIFTLPDAGVEIFPKGDSVEQDQAQNGFKGEKVEHDEFRSGPVLGIKYYPEYQSS